jgi:hypothetical protein
MASEVYTFLDPPPALKIERDMEIDGIGMGVLSDGTAYLTLRGLARMCGVDPILISRMATAWTQPGRNPREAKIREILSDLGPTPTELYIKVMKDGVAHHAFPDIVCMAVLEYYAFHSNSPSRDHALLKYRALARRSFKDFIYGQLGYRPETSVPIAWRQFLDRVTLLHDRVPTGYFCVFKEIAGIVVTLIKHGAEINHRFVPDISVGTNWSRHWKSMGFDKTFGVRLTYSHVFPDYFPQAPSNPQPAFCYPDAALGEFRRWIHDVYLPEKFPIYIKTKIKDGGLPPSFAWSVLRALGYEADQPALPPPTKAA